MTEKAFAAIGRVKLVNGLTASQVQIGPNVSITGGQARCPPVVEDGSTKIGLFEVGIAQVVKEGAVSIALIY